MRKTALLLIGLVFAAALSAQDLVSDFQKKYGKDAEFTIVNITPKCSS